MTGGARVRGAALGLVLAALLATGCGQSVPTSPPTGVDQLVVPTPDPRPADFVARVDNPWLSWTPGATTRFTQTATGAGPVAVTESVSAGTTTVAGLTATTLTTVTPTGSTVDWFAEDRDGNVWWLGRQGEWVAGEAGAEAGLWMPAHPRTGDGFRPALAPGVEDERAETTLLAGDPSSVRVTVRSDREPRLEERTYVEGEGLTEVVGAAFERARE